MEMRRFGILAAVLGGVGVSSSAWAAVVTFAPATTISGDTDISKPVGATVVNAITFSNSGPVTVNGVTFTALAGGNQSTITSGNLSLAVSGTGTAGDAGNAYTGGTNNPYASLSTNMQSLVSHGVYNDGSQFQLTYSNLTVGQNYQFETLVNDSRPIQRSQTVTSGGGNTVTLLYATSGSAGALGQYTIGTFKADAVTQVITYASGNSQINATVLESVPAPEPASLSFLTLGGFGLLARRRRFI